MTTPNGAGLGFAVVDISATGDNTIIAAAAGKSIFVNRVILALATQTTIQFKAGSRALSGPQSLTKMVLDYSDQAWFVCNPGEAFIINLGGNVATGGTVWFQYGP